MAGGGKQYPASVVGILWGDTGRKNTVAFRGTGRTVADRYFCTVFLKEIYTCRPDPWYDLGGIYDANVRYGFAGQEYVRCIQRCDQ